MSRSSHPRQLALAAALISAAACRDGGGDGKLHAYGTIEARQVDVSSRSGGRIVAVLADEDDLVRRGQALVRFDLSEMDAQQAQARAALAGAQAKLNLLEQGAQSEDITAARKALDAARIREESSRRELERARMLVAGSAAPEKAVDDARTALELAESDVASRSAQLAKIVGGARAEELVAAGAARDQAQAALTAVDDRLTDREILAPLDAVVVHRLVEPGEVARPAQALLVLGDLAHPYLDVYVPEPHLGEARIGALAEVRIDAYRDKRFRASVSHVSSVAEFTPKNVQTEDQRARLVYRVRLDVEDPEGLLRPGMPGEAIFTGAVAQPRPADAGAAPIPGVPDAGAPDAGARRK